MTPAKPTFFAVSRSNYFMRIITTGHDHDNDLCVLRRTGALHWLPKVQNSWQKPIYSIVHVCLWQWWKLCRRAAYQKCVHWLPLTRLLVQAGAPPAQVLWGALDGCDPDEFLGILGNSSSSSYPGFPLNSGRNVSGVAGKTSASLPLCANLDRFPRPRVSIFNQGNRK